MYIGKRTFNVHIISFSQRFKILVLSIWMQTIFIVYFRWRKLGGKDPPTLELIQKIQTLQKRLIARKEDIVDRETSIREKVM